jgi:Mn2+/Fe2+ NRAMP family transporter
MRSEYERARIGPLLAGILPDALAAPDPTKCSPRPAPIPPLQSNVIDKRITPRWIQYERADTAIGALVVVAGAAAVMISTAAGFDGGKDFGQYTDALGSATGLARYAGPHVGAIFSILLVDASIIGASAVTLATSLPSATCSAYVTRSTAALRRPDSSTAATRPWWRSLPRSS